MYAYLILAEVKSQHCQLVEQVGKELACPAGALHNQRFSKIDPDHVAMTNGRCQVQRRPL